MSATSTAPASHPLDHHGAGKLPAPVSLTAAEQEALLDLARVALSVTVGVARSSELESTLDRITVRERWAAAFVTLTERGELRGCMGWMDPTTPVVESVATAASWAASRDPRFLPVAASELPWITIEVSVLGPLTELASPERVRAGIDGILVERGARHGLLLPEVATAHGLDRAGMLGAACEKAGLPRDAWRQPETALLVFRTARFGGPALAGPGPVATVVHRGR